MGTARAFVSAADRLSTLGAAAALLRAVGFPTGATDSATTGAALASIFAGALVRALRAEAALRVGAAVPRLVRPVDCRVRSALRAAERSPPVFRAAEVLEPVALDAALLAEEALAAAVLAAVVLAAAVLAEPVLAAIVLPDVLEAAVFAVLAAAVLTARLSAPALFFDFVSLDFALDLAALDLLVLEEEAAAAFAVRDRVDLPSVVDLASVSLAPRLALAGALRFFAVFLLEGIRGYSSSCPAVETGRKAT